MKEFIALVHKAISKNQPKSIVDFFTFSVRKNYNIHTIRKPIHHNIPKSNCMNKTIFVNGLHMYNSLLEDIKRKILKYYQNI